MKKLTFLIPFLACLLAPTALAAAPDAACDCHCKPQPANLTVVDSSRQFGYRTVPNICTPPKTGLVLGKMDSQSACEAVCTTAANCSSLDACYPSCKADTDCASGQACLAGYCGKPPESDSKNSEQPASKEQFKLITPTLSISIPTLDLSAFSKITKGTDKNGNDYIVLPYIAAYLSAAFRLGIGIAAALAVIIIMAGGFIWVASAGDTGRIDMAKKMISGAVIGLLLTLGSYIFLQIVNPDILEMGGLKVVLVQPRGIDIFEDFGPETEGEVSVGGAPSAYDPIFAKYAPCAHVTPETLKAIATVESGLDTNRVNRSGYIGLFQTKQANCPASVAKYCTDLKNPENNTAVASAMIRKSADYISAKCPGSDAHDQMVMIYVAHNMGFGMLKHVTKSSCDVDKMRKAAINYYVNNPGTAAAYAPKYQSGCLAGRSDINALAECTGGPKFDYAARLANKSDVSQVIAQGGTCPY